MRARHTGPDLAIHNAPTTFDTLGDARAWLRSERADIDAGEWVAPASRAMVAQAEHLNLSTYATTWLDERKLAPRTRAH